MSTPAPVVSKGETILITGASGWLGSHIAEVALEHGLSVRLASRSESKIQPLVDALSAKYDVQSPTSSSGSRISVAIVKDFAAEGAYDEHVLGSNSSSNSSDSDSPVTGIVHAASDVTFSEDYDSVVGSSLRGYESILRAARKSPRIKRVVFTSSSVALGLPNPNGKFTQHLDRSSWNDAAVKLAQDPSKRNAFLVYAASKVITERRVWDFVEKEHPHFIVNVVNPNFIMGAKVAGFQYGSTGHWLRESLLKGDMTMANMLGPQYHVDAYDTALLHVLALTRQDIASERILAFGDRFTWSQLIDLTKEFRPDLQNTPSKTEQTDAHDNTTIDTDRSKDILKQYGGFKDLRHSVQANLARD